MGSVHPPDATVIVSRRHFLGVAGGSVAVFAPGSAATQAPLTVRRRVGDPAAATDVADYRRAVQLMQALPERDARSWTRQARTHSDACPHGNWWFLPWHRAYLHFFEGICRQLLNKPSFALPYWDWTRDFTIPADFWGAGNPLAHPRDRRPTDRIDRSVGSIPRNVRDVLASPDFVKVGSGEATRLRGDPQVKGTFETAVHDAVHMWIGRDMTTMMSPLDPVFWAHHANVDRVWAEWQQAHHGGDPVSPVWLNLPLTFVDAAGRPSASSARQVLSTRDMGYRYDTQPERPLVQGVLPTGIVAAAVRQLQARATALADQNLLAPQTGRRLVAVQFPALAEPLRAGLSRQAAGRPANGEPESTRLVIEDMKVSRDTNFGLAVYLNSPAPDQAAGADDSHYVGSVFFFGLDHAAGDAGHGHGGAGPAVTSAVLSLDATLTRLGAEVAGRPLTFQFVANPVVAGGAMTGTVELPSLRVEVAGKRPG